MSEERGQDPRTEREGLVALAALDGETAALEQEERAHLEVLGLLAYEVDDVAPDPGVRRALMAELERSRGGSVAPLESRAPSREVVPSRWMWRIAAVLAAALLGLSGLQYAELGRQREQIETQEARISELRDQLAERPGSEGAPTWLASSGTELCELQPRAARAAESKGWLFVREDHQHWYVALEGLAPPPPGQVYELWFLVEDQLVSGGSFQPDDGGRAVLASPTMPSGVTGVAVTLEPADGDDTPSEEMVLFGDEVMLIL